VEKPREIVLTDCGSVGWLAVIREPFGGRELWRIGSHAKTEQDAFAKAIEVWYTDGTGDIKAYKRGEEF
jgi:hypothetical protein